MLTTWEAPNFRGTRGGAILGIHVPRAPTEHPRRRMGGRSEHEEVEGGSVGHSHRQGYPDREVVEPFLTFANGDYNWSSDPKEHLGWFKNATLVHCIQMD